VPKAEEGGVDAELQYVKVNEDTEEPKANFADEGKPRYINLVDFGNSSNYLMIVHLCLGVEMKP
jgi:hypothetical protein